MVLKNFLPGAALNQLRERVGQIEAEPLQEPNKGNVHKIIDFGSGADGIEGSILQVAWKYEDVVLLLSELKVYINTSLL